MAMQQSERNNLFNRFQSEIDQMLERERGDASELATKSRPEWMPPVDIEETEDAYTIHVDVPGMDPQDIDVTFENGILSVEGQRKSERTVGENRTRRVERSFGTFVRRFSLPDAADADGIEAKINKGVLNLTIQKRSESKPRKIEVQG